MSFSMWQKLMANSTEKVVPCWAMVAAEADAGLFTGSSEIAVGCGVRDGAGLVENGGLLHDRKTRNAWSLGMARSGNIEQLFVSSLYRAQISARGLNAALAKTCLAIAAEDKAGQRWSKAHGYKGYTSYASLDDLPFRASVFAELVTQIDKHVRSFGKALDFELSGKSLALDSLWINVMDRGGIHSAHIHPHSVVSGTYYVDIPNGAADIRFEDPRLAMMMAAPPRKEKARRENQIFARVSPKPGTLLLWESFLRHEVLPNTAPGKRISISFNYAMR
jgi:uncharacterized protein (TIGR02466 family)